MADTIEDVTIQYEEDGEVIVEQLDKHVLTKGSWSTIMYRYRERNRSSGEMGADKFSIRRYQKRNGVYKPQSKFNISSEKQARQIVETLTSWLDG